MWRDIDNFREKTQNVRSEEQWGRKMEDEWTCQQLKT